jgi:tungstate transport system substrate-binding protein
MHGGHGTCREAVMHNDFVVVGPADDPAKIKGASSAAEAFTRIAKARAPFASRADESGTNTKELSLWQAAGIKPSGSWYIETGQGMGETLTIANQKQAYTLSDRGTYLATKNLDSKLLVEGGKDLINPYHVIVVKGEDVNRECGQRFSDWIISTDVQREIGRFGVARYGEPLFVADAAG